jgi:hypothetical protein
VYGDIVFYNGSAYFCKVATSGTLPTDTSKWDMIVQKGDTGLQGIQGIQGIQGEK